MQRRGVGRMMSRRLVAAVAGFGLAINSGTPTVWNGSAAGSLSAAELSAAAVLQAIEAGKRHLLDAQKPDGSWTTGTGHRTGVTCLAVLAMLNSGATANDPPIRKALDHLRRLPANEPDETYEVSLLLMALVAAKAEGRGDQPRIAQLAERLESFQSRGAGAGGWSYGAGGSPDLSNSQFAVLALREAADANVQVSRGTWERIRQFWTSAQNADGGWSYSFARGDAGGASTGSMTVAGVSSLAIAERMLQNDDGVTPDGTAPCCRPAEPNRELERGIAWLGRNYAAGHNPGANMWTLYYVYGVERAGRLSGRRFFGERDWYREGASFLLKSQTKRNGAWVGQGMFEGESDGIVGTSYALLFLSKGLSPVVVNKLKWGRRDAAQPMEIAGADWNRHPRDVRTLIENLSGLPKWPKLMTVQELDLPKAVAAGSVDAFLQAPILYITGSESPGAMSAAEIDLMRQYIERGGFIFATASCSSKDFEPGLRTLVSQLFPPGEGELKPLAADHAVYRSEYLISPESMPFLGVDFGCRTPVVYCPEDLGCYWEYWQRPEPAKRNPNLKAKVLRAVQAGANVVAYATGREPPDKLKMQELAAPAQRRETIERGLLQIAQLKHSGDWNAAPNALKHLLFALNDAVGVTASTQARSFFPSDERLFDYPLIAMHGRQKFEWNAQEVERMRTFLERGGLLFADSCCGAKSFDQSFRAACKELFPANPLAPVPNAHLVFSDSLAHDARRLRRRLTDPPTANKAATSRIVEQETQLEGVEIDGRYVILYSPHDLSCALERPAAQSCDGYVPADAVKLATNIVLYALLQEVRLGQ